MEENKMVISPLPVNGDLFNEETLNYSAGEAPVLTVDDVQQVGDLFAGEMTVEEVNIDELNKMDAGVEVPAPATPAVVAPKTVVTGASVVTTAFDMYNKVPVAVGSVCPCCKKSSKQITSTIKQYCDEHYPSFATVCVQCQIDMNYKVKWTEFAKKNNIISPFEASKATMTARYASKPAATPAPAATYTPAPQPQAQPNPTTGVIYSSVSEVKLTNDEVRLCKKLHIVHPEHKGLWYKIPELVQMNLLKDIN